MIILSGPSKIGFKIFILILQLIVCLAFLQTLDAAEEWKLVEDGDGVKVYESSWEGHSENRYKGVGIIQQPIEVVAAILADIDSYPEWFHRCSEAKKLKDNKSSLLDFFLYIVIDVPWPFANRNAVFHAQTTIDSVSEKIVINSVAQIDSDMPPHADYIRITNSAQQWNLEKLAPHKTRITFFNQTGSSGSMAAFITDMGSQATVYQSLINMKKVAAHPRYEALGNELQNTFR